MRSRRAGASRSPSILTVVALAAAMGTPLSAQSLMVASSAVVIDHESRTGTMTLVNDGAEAVEATISTFYGYPVTDSLGNMYLRTFTAVDDTMPSAATWIESFPRRLRIGPKSRATVRLLVTPPADLPPGEYWARVMVAAKVGKIPVAAPAARSDIRASLDLEVRSIVGVFYRVGDPRTGIAVQALSAERNADSLVGRVTLARRGNAAFVGSIRARLRDGAGRIRAERLLPLGVYYTLEPRFTLPVAGLAAGRYALAIEALSSRPDLAAGLILPAASVTRSIDVVLP